MMRLFRKKPTSLDQRAALGLVGGTPIAVSQYAPVLRDAFNRAANYREPSEIASSLGLGKLALSDRGPTLLTMVVQEFASLSGAVRRLQEVHPDVPLLLDLHVAAVSYLEQVMTMAHELIVSLRLDVQGDEQSASQVYADAQRRKAALLKAQHFLAGEVKQLKRRDRTLYTALAIPYEILEWLDVL